jgi:predicted N-acyltransferase
MPLELRLLSSIAELPEATWDALLREDSSPFVEWAYLEALEHSGCVDPKRGWAPRHVALFRGTRLVAAAPCYVKGNSEGEFVFDHGWASGAQRLGVKYYPKLLSAVPFTPQVGDRVLVAEGEAREATTGLVADALRTIAFESGLSSGHVLFLEEAQARTFEQRGWAMRRSVQFHFENRGYASFGDFLARAPGFDSKRRNQVKRERRRVGEEGVTVETRRGSEVDDATLEHAYAIYLSTVEKFAWGRRYLNERFFERVRDAWAGREADPRRPRRGQLEVVVARAGERLVAGAINYAKQGRLYGRHWGTIEPLPFVHFEVCYYHSIEECIARGFASFEPGVQGEETKGPRGFSPVLTWSAHVVKDARLDAAVRDYVAREREVLESEYAGLETSRTALR